MSDYFNNFPIVQYQDKTVTNITKSVKILDGLRNTPYAFLPYTVKDGERPEDVAYYYYGSVAFTWLVLLSDKTIDPYKKWPMDNQQLHAHIKKKYEAQAIADGQTDVLAWTQNTLITSNIQIYRLLDDSDILITPFTYNNDPNLVGGDWEAVRYFDYEFEVNEARRPIQLLNDVYKNVALQNLKDLLDE